MWRDDFAEAEEPRDQVQEKMHACELALSDENPQIFATKVVNTDRSAY